MVIMASPPRSQRRQPLTRESQAAALRARRLGELSFLQHALWAAIGCSKAIA